MTLSTLQTFDRTMARAAFDEELVRLDACIHREILRLRARYELSLDEFRGLYVSDRQVDELIRRMPGANDGVTAPLDIESLEAPPGAGDGIHTPWSHLRQRLALERGECDLLLACLAPELDARYETLFAYLNNDVTRKWPTLELITRLFTGDSSRRSALRAHLQPDSRLMRIGLLEFVAGRGDLPRAQRGLRVAPPIVDWLLGLPYCDELLQGHVQPLGIDAAPAAYGVNETAVAKAAACVAADQPVNFVCCAGSAEEAMADAHRLFAEAGREALAVDLTVLRHCGPDLLLALERAATVLDLGLVLSPVEALSDGERPHDLALAMARRLARRPLQMAWVGGRESRGREVFAGNECAPCHLLSSPEPEPWQRAEVWRAALQDAGHAVDVHVLADRFTFGPAGVARVVRHAELGAQYDGEFALSQSRLLASARAVSSEALGGMTRNVVTRFGWSDLILPGPVKRRLQDVVAAVEARPQVLDEWGFAAKLGNARGIKVMFSGQSGTGKTMAAAIIARELSLDLHRVELAAVVSKYIGETEKNLDRAFETARRTNAILFVDEADALLGKRSEVKDAHDRYANVETAYLLQKMEDHDGVVILATNLPGNLDEAFSRRMHFVIDFPMPDVTSRERLWRSMIPERAPVAEDVDLPFLARQFVFAGGDIRNVVLDAAYLAAQEGGQIAMRHFLAAVARQFAKRGKLPTASEFREYFSMLSDGPVAAPEPRFAAERVP